ncbi:hypothetical protein [Desulfocurvus sp. DL9XJH121]
MPSSPATARHRAAVFAPLALAALLLLAWAAPCGAGAGGRVRLVPFGNEEMVFVRLPDGAFSWPASEVLDGKEPRIILDFKGVREWDEAYVPDGGGKIVRRIRTYLHKDEQRLRVVLDLAASPRRYAITLGYDIRPHGAEISVSAIPLRRTP